MLLIPCFFQIQGFRNGEKQNERGEHDRKVFSFSFDLVIFLVKLYLELLHWQLYLITRLLLIWTRVESRESFQDSMMKHVHQYLLCKLNLIG